MSNFSGKVALVTGGASGLGQGLCEELSRRGARVVLTDINIEAALKLAKRLQQAGGNVEAASLDVTSPERVAEVITSVVNHYGRLDYVFNNAGVGVGGEFQELDPTTWRRTVDINLLGVVYVMYTAYQQMMLQRSGHIVNIASMYGLMPGVLCSPYVATKHALTGLTQSVASEAKNHGIKLTVVCPGYIDTNLFKSGAYGKSVNAEQIKSRIPLKFIDVPTAVKNILRGVEGGQLIVAFPRYVHIFWWIYRLSPQLSLLINNFIMRKQRQRYGSL
ncbi:SDR family oxidoreductase [Dendronalium sp. ChiSLP03b]|uniref:SDR family NAD(P)-dependent oxidoreductase n=1 Tax=Dendronalium sp. ChiSLP03b TaxID=3075381 RepID=UPI002AD3A4DB|nr:SDR family oxidoreductase [Dendronalium sp. ChiSLP03b]MDZ8206057.1 SDR family oxidoreductase [Dendronalium sp. ChiSLP03b]